MAHELAAAPTAAVYGRIGTTTTEFGSTASWLVDVVNTLSGNLDRPGGSMFATPVAGGATTRGRPGTGKGFKVGRGHTRVSGHPEVMGEYPVGALAEEITTPGDGQIRALVTLAGNPVLSTPNSNQLADALDELEFMVSIDLYLNETTRHADVILPVPSQLERGHYDLLLLQFAMRNVANYSEPVLPARRRPARRVGGDLEAHAHRPGHGSRRRPGDHRRHGDRRDDRECGEGRVLERVRTRPRRAPCARSTRPGGAAPSG